MRILLWLEVTHFLKIHKPRLCDNLYNVATEIAKVMVTFR
jgi:hypothetical protein